MVSLGLLGRAAHGRAKMAARRQCSGQVDRQASDHLLSQLKQQTHTRHAVSESMAFGFDLLKGPVGDLWLRNPDLRVRRRWSGVSQSACSSNADVFVKVEYRFIECRVPKAQFSWCQYRAREKTVVELVSETA